MRLFVIRMSQDCLKPHEAACTVSQTDTYIKQSLQKGEK